MTATGRIASLDLIRGVAVMGIFSVNVIGFALVEPAYLNPAAAGGHGGADLALWLANYVLIDGKMRTLFSMLFGASMLLITDGAEAAGRSPAAVHYRRMIVLLLCGLLHYFIIWHGDILTLYALCGMLAFAFRRLDVTSLLGLAMTLFIASAISLALVGAQLREADVAAHARGASRAEIRVWNDSASMAARPSAANAAETRLALSPTPDRIRHALTVHALEPLRGFAGFGLPTLALMLFGMAGYRSGFLTGAWPRETYRRIATRSLPAGGLVTLVLALWIVATGFYIPLLYILFVAVGPFLQLAMAAGYAALIILVARPGGGLSERIAAVGRAAFSNYLGTSIVAALIFYGDGLALFGTLSRAEAWLVVPPVWLAMLLWSKPWLDRYRYGPFEWAWRSLARWRWEPLRRGAVPA